MQGDKPAGGQWNFDHDNRKPAKADLFRPRPPRFAPDPITEEVLALVEARFPGNFGTPSPVRLGDHRAEASRRSTTSSPSPCPRFGDEQDAMLAGDPTLSPRADLALPEPRPA